MNLFRRACKAVVRVGGFRLSSGGFTTIELLVTVGIIALLGGATVASFDAYLRKTSLQKAAFQIASELYNSKARAIRAKADCTTAFDNVAHTYQTTLSSVINPDPMVNLSDLRGNVTFTANPGPPPDAFSVAIGFNFRGLTVDGNAAQIYVQGTDAAGNVYRIYRIQVMASGAISVRYWEPATLTWVQ